MLRLFILFHLLICHHFLAATHELYYYWFSITTPHISSPHLSFLFRHFLFHLAHDTSSLHSPFINNVSHHSASRPSISNHHGAHHMPFLLTHRLILNFLNSTELLWLIRSSRHPAITARRPLSSLPSRLFLASNAISPQLSGNLNL